MCLYVCMSHMENKFIWTYIYSYIYTIFYVNTCTSEISYQRVFLLRSRSLWVLTWTCHGFKFAQILQGSGWRKSSGTSNTRHPHLETCDLYTAASLLTLIISYQMVSDVNTGYTNSLVRTHGATPCLSKVENSTGQSSNSLKVIVQGQHPNKGPHLGHSVGFFFFGNFFHTTTNSSNYTMAGLQIQPHDGSITQWVISF